MKPPPPKKKKLKELEAKLSSQSFFVDNVMCKLRFGSGKIIEIRTDPHDFFLYYIMYTVS